MDAPRREIAHVLFMDVVGYARLPLDEQLERSRELQELVRRQPEFHDAEAGRDLLCLPTGDGMALVFFRDPTTPVQCAIGLAAAARSLPHLPLRIGLHSGPVYRVEDINAHLNASGGGINLAQRVMDCGDGGHILLSSTIAELIEQVGDWPLRDLGECEVKHGRRLRLFNLCTQEVGNPERPSKLGRKPDPTGVGALPDGQRPESSRLPEETPSSAVTVEPGRGRVVILYKREAQPDEQVLQLVERQLLAQGYQVFVDRHLLFVMHWAREIERQIRGADAVIPLLSAAAVGSEMLSYEIQLARDAAVAPQGRPRLLPVRVAYDGPLPEPLAGILDPLEYGFWGSPTDDETLCARLVEALQSPPQFELAGSGAGGRRDLEPVGGALPLDSRFYVVRPTDEEFEAAISRQDSIVLVKGARQMGKTSLLARGLQRARQDGARVALTDLQTLSPAHLESAHAFFSTLALLIAEQLDLDLSQTQGWDECGGAGINFRRFLRREVLQQLDSPLVWGIDEVDRLFGCHFSNEVFGLFRSWHNERALDPTGPWSRLTLAIVYATEAHLFITDLNQSPFNVGTRLTLADFTQQQVADLNARYGAHCPSGYPPLRDAAEVERYCRLVGGHPGLVQRGLHDMASHQVRLDALEARADRDDGIFGDHLRRLLVSLARDPELCEAVRGLLRGEPCRNEEIYYRLRSAGVIAGDSAAAARPRCWLYAAYLQRHLP